MKFTSLALALFGCSMLHAATPIDGFYMTGFGGYAYVPGNVNTIFHSQWISHASYQAGYDAGASLGYKSTPMRYEGELTYLSANVEHFNVFNMPQVGVSGHGNAGLAMANVYYDLPNVLNTFQPYLGIGIGYGWISAHLDSTAPLGGVQFSGTNNVFSYQAMGGLAYNFSEQYALNIGYRYASTTQANNIGNTFQAQLANLGAVYRFDGHRYA